MDMRHFLLFVGCVLFISPREAIAYKYYRNIEWNFVTLNASESLVNHVKSAAEEIAIMIEIVKSERPIPDAFGATLINSLKQCTNYAKLSSGRRGVNVTWAVVDTLDFVDETLTTFSDYAKNITECAKKNKIKEISNEVFGIPYGNCTFEAFRGTKEEIDSLLKLSKEFEDHVQSSVIRARVCLNKLKNKNTVAEKDFAEKETVSCLNEISIKLPVKCDEFANEILKQGPKVILFVQDIKETLVNCLNEKKVDIRERILKDKAFDIDNCKK